MAPVPAVIDSPAGEALKVPPVVPIIVGFTSAPFEQKFAAGYEIVALGAGTIVTLTVAVASGQGDVPVTVYV
jgi:hypothetical protein